MRRNERGQASILVAIIFEVLFIFFGMVINIGLLVHDKINLQNSVDVAAYYGAMKQAEVLNVMAHVNYQLRQNWKLLNWRLWVLANASRNDDLYVTHNRQPPDEEREFKDSWKHEPLVCIDNNLWFDCANARKCEEACQKGQDFNPPAFAVLPPDPIAAIFNPAYEIARVISQQNENQYDTGCAETGALNYEAAALFLESFKETAAQKRTVMHRLQNLLIQPSNGSNRELNDIAGDLVSQTVRKVLTYNLTAANKASFDSKEGFDFYNSLVAQPFLVPIDVQVIVRYLDYGRKAGGCPALPAKVVGTHSGSDKPEKDPKNLYPRHRKKMQVYMFADTGGATQPQVINADYFWRGSTSPPDATFTSLVGFEKNPWVAAYVKVVGRTQPRMLFWPGKNRTVKMEATAYAMPFGGKFGPWYFKAWNPGDERSSGDFFNKDSMYDRLLPPRLDVAIANLKDAVPPNYSRYPGDDIGMKSRLAQAQVWNIWFDAQSLKPKFAAGKDDYNNIVGRQPRETEAVIFSTHNSAIRVAELTAIAPDVFDSTYYSIDEQFNENYSKKSPKLFSDYCSVPEGETGAFSGCHDLGSRVDARLEAKVKDHIDAARTTPWFWWIISNPDHLLTSWTQSSTDSYDNTDLVGVRPGESKLGGRIGFSVKLVSEKFLSAPNLPLGGQGSPGPLRNPPDKLP